MDLNQVRYSRAGDVFHYRWAARRCLNMIHPKSSIESIFIEGSQENTAKGEYVIDVAEYDKSEMTGNIYIRYFQLKHSTKRVCDNYQLSELRKTFEGFSQRFNDLISDDYIDSIQFFIVTNRPINPNLKKTIQDIVDGSGANKQFYNTLSRYTDFDGDKLKRFCQCLNFQDGEGNYIAQKFSLHSELAQIHAGLVESAEVDNIIALIQDKALPHTNGKIVKEEILQRIGVTSEKDLFPAPLEVVKPENIIKREQHDELMDFVLENSTPKIIHASGGVGKSVVAIQLAESLPEGSVGIVYDCFGSGKYRNRSQPRHRHRDALVQIVNELASQGLCDLLIPRRNDLDDSILRGFLRRIENAISKIKEINQNAVLAIFIDAADNAEMAAEENSEPCFANQLLREEFPRNCRIIFLCRTERISLLKPPYTIQKKELLSFSEDESFAYLRSFFPSATQDDGHEFHRLTNNGNPRVQTNAINSSPKSLSTLLDKLGPHGLSVEDQITAQLNSAVSKAKELLSESLQSEIEDVCFGLANLPPLVPLEILSKAANVDVSVVRSFIADLGRPLWLSDNAVQFRDEPTETWFFDNYSGSKEQIEIYIERLKPLSSDSTYVAEVLPSLLLKAEKYDELISLALSEDLLPENPIDKRNVRIYRLQFAFKAALKKKRFTDSAILAFRTGEEVASNDRQYDLLKQNVDLVALLQSKEKVQELAYRKILNGAWDGSDNVYSASLLSYVEDCRGEARGYLRAAERWLQLYFEERKKAEEDHHRDKLQDEHILELVSAYLNIFDVDRLVDFILSWRPNRVIYSITKFLTKRLIDGGNFLVINKIARKGKRNTYLILAIADELLKVGKILPSELLYDCLDLLIHKRARPKKSATSWRTEPDDIVFSILSFLENCVRQGLCRKKILRTLNHYMPQKLNSAITDMYNGAERNLFFRGLALKLVLVDDLEPDSEKFIPEKLLKKEGYERDQEVKKIREIFGEIMPWYLLRAKTFDGNIENAEEEISNAEVSSKNSRSSSYKRHDPIPYEISRTYFDILLFSNDESLINEDNFKKRFFDSDSFRITDRLNALRTVFRVPHFSKIKYKLEQQCFHEVENTKNIDTETRAEWYIDLSRAVLIESPEDSTAYFDKAIESVSKFGYEIVQRWEALVEMANHSSKRNEESSEIAYRFIRIAELVGDNVAREKHFDRDAAIQVCTKICPKSSLSALSRWRDRDVGWFDRQLKALTKEIVISGDVKPLVGWSLSTFNTLYPSVDLASLCIEKEPDEIHHNFIFDDIIKNMSLNNDDESSWRKIKELAENFSYQNNHLDYVLCYYNEKNKDLESPSKKNISDSEGIDNISQNKLEETFAGLDLLDEKGISQSIQNYNETPPPRNREIFWNELFVRIPVNKANQFLKLIVSHEEIDLYDIRYILKVLPYDWTQKISIKKSWPNLIESIGYRFAIELSNHWSREYFLNFISFSEEEILDLSKGIIQGLSESSIPLDSNIYFGFSGIISAFISPKEASKILDFAISRFEIHLDDDYADGNWTEWLLPPENTTDAFTGFIWSALGSPRSHIRWKAAHCVRKLAEANCNNEISSLVNWLEKGTVDSFGSKDFIFYGFHAKLYLLIALSRVSIDNSTLLRDHSKIFSRIALSEAHVLIQKFAKEIALSIESNFPKTYSQNQLKKIKNIGRSKFDLVNKVSSTNELFSSPWHKEGIIDTDLEIYLAYDFDRYWFPSLADTFGIPTSQVMDLVRDVIVNHWGIESDDKSIEDARSVLWNSPSNRETWHSHSSYPETDDYRFYISYHALFVVASKLLSNMPLVKKRDYIDDPWVDWLDRHILIRDDGKWLADRRDYCPLIRRDWVKSEKSENWRTEIQDKDFFNALIENEFDDTWLNIGGHWTEYESERKERISISSAFVSPEGSQSLLNALTNCKNAHDFKLPSYDDREDFEFDDYPLELKGWILQFLRNSGIDEFDPHAADIDYPPYIIGDLFQDRFNLMHDSEKRNWYKIDSEQKLVNCKIWSLKTFDKKDEPFRKGNLISATKEFLLEMCSTMNREIIIEVQIDRSFFRPHYSRSTGENDYLPSKHKIYILSKDGTIRDSRSSYKIG